MMLRVLETIFIVDVSISIVLLVGALWSVGTPIKRIWPPPGRVSWQYRLTWIFFYVVFGLNLALLVLNWNTWIFESNLRFVIGIPLALIGAFLVVWGVITLGSLNTSGVRDGFISSGPYTFTRNPQYLGDIILFIGLSIIANSLYLWITHILLIIVFLVTPLAEELWLEEQYGEEYVEYKNGTARFI